MKLSSSRKKYLLQKHFQVRNDKNIPAWLSQFGCRSCDTTDEDLFFITQYVSEIDRLSLGDSAITAGGLEYLKKIKQAKYLDLGGVPLTDENMDCILHLSGLEYLYVKHTAVSPNGVSAILDTFPKLETLVADIPSTHAYLLETWKNNFPRCELAISVH